LRGVQRQLDAIEAAQPTTAEFIGRLRRMAESFQLDALQQQLSLTLDERARA
jgi:hypothetical protein